EGPDRLSAAIEYNSDLFDPATIASMAENYQRILEQVVTDPGRRLCDLSLLSGFEGKSPSSQLVVFNSELFRERDYWLKRLASCLGRCSLPEERSSEGGRERQIKSFRYELSAETCGKLRRLAGESDFLTYTALHAAVKLCLYHYNRSGRVVVGTPALMEAARGNALAIVDEVEERETFKQYLMRVRNSLLEGYENERYPYERLRGEVGRQAGDERGERELFQVCISMRGLHGELRGARA